MPCFTRLLSALLLSALAAAAASPTPPEAGVAEGSADCLFLLEGPTDAPPPPQVTCGSFRQTVRRRGAAWEVSVATAPRSVPGAAASAPRWDDAPLLALPEEFRAALASAVGSPADADEACARVAAFLETRLAYTEDPAASPDPAEVCRLGRASCVGRARVAALALGALGLQTRPVIGLRAPAEGTPQTLAGGALHVWLEVRAPGAAPAYFDPAFSVGWLPSRYVVLREGGGDSPGDLARWRGGSLRTLWRRDRIFYETGRGGGTRLWRAAGGPRGGASVLGKLLDGRDAPLPGTAYLRGPSGTFAVTLWEGNFCFGDLPPGDYELALDSGGPAARDAFTLLPMDKRSRVFYSRTGKGPAADHGTGRQPGGSLSP